MRRAQLKKLIKRLQHLEQMSFKDSRELVLKLGEAKGRYRNAWRLLDVSLPDASATSFSFRLNRDKLAQARRREGRYLLRTNLCGRDPQDLWRFYIQLTEVEAAFKNLKDDLKVRPIYHQLEHRIEAHIFVAFMAYCLHVSLRAQLKALAPGLTSRAVLDKFAAIQMLDVHFPTTAEGGQCVAFEADVTKEQTLAIALSLAHKRWGRVDILHNNVGVSIAGADASPLEITEEAFDRINAINLRGTIMACKHVLPIMRQQRSGAIINISSIAAWIDYPLVAYKATKAAMIAFTQQIAIQNAEFGIRANVILPGLMDTPMAVDTRAREWGKSRAEVVAERNAKVPLRARMGTAWDVANAALFLASDEANFITGIALPVDGGALVRIG